MPQNNSFDTYQSFIYKSRYARWLDEKGRRENWNETIDRYIRFMYHQLDHLETRDKEIRWSTFEEAFNNLRDMITEQRIMPSMRALMTAGPALDREHIAGYNCSYVPIDNPRCFDEILYILMNGTGVGFSVERNCIHNLPSIPDSSFQYTDDRISVADSKEGWARSLRDLISYLYTSRIPKIDYSKVRPAGARLKTFGGRASGPEPLEDLFKFVINIFTEARGRKLSSIECHDIVCKIGDVVVSGGVRRSALLSLSDLYDDRMRHAKVGEWYNTEPQRALANNSVAYTHRPSIESFMQEWLSLVMSKSGERGMFNREAAQRQAARFGRRSADADYGTNPCSEIILLPNQFCNLTEAVCRPDDTAETLMEKVAYATILGTFQATMTNFHYLRKRWKDTTEKERLLGVSLTGIMDCPLLNKNGESLEKLLVRLREHAVEINKKWSKMLGIPVSAAITCVKPSGTVSQLTNAASGIHPRHSQYYVRTVRGDNKDPLVKFLKEAGVVNEPDVMFPDNNTVFSFPVKCTGKTVTRNDISAVEHLELWMTYSEHWCEHKPSITVSVREEEWMEVGAWCYKNFDRLSGISFLPHSEHAYRQAPYQECSKEEYQELYKTTPKNIDWEKMNAFESEDNTKASQELACTAGVCEIVDI